MPEAPVLDLPHIRGTLAAHRITHKALAEAAGLSQQYVSKILCGQPHGELARIKIARALDRLGMESEVRRAS